MQCWASGGQIGHINKDVESAGHGDGMIGHRLLIAYPEFPLHVFDVFITVLDIQDP